MSETIEKKDVAPLGLDFEMPETVWVWEVPGGRYFVRSTRLGSLVYAALSDPDIVAVARFKQGTQDVLRGGRFSGGWPVSHPLEEFLASLRNSVGVLLVDETGKEIWRRYVR